MALHQIKSWMTGKVLFSLECVGMRVCLEAAVEAKTVLSDADLRGADLSGADLSDAVLSGADLSGAVLSDADLSDAVLRDAVLRDADLRGAVLSDAVLRDADLRDADLRGAVLSDADLRDADLRGADLSGADLRGAVLSDAVLRDADLSDIKEDLFAVLNAAPGEVRGLLDTLLAERVDGSQYQGDCACLVGTIANVRHCKHDEIPGIVPDSSRPAEVWFMAIRPGHTPENSAVAKITAEWINEWLAAHETAGVKA